MAGDLHVPVVHLGLGQAVDGGEEHREMLRAAARHGARNVRMIGSVARGDARPDSDLDLLVELDRGRSLLDHAALMIELEALLGCKVDVATEEGLRRGSEIECSRRPCRFEARPRASARPPPSARRSKATAPGRVGSLRHKVRCGPR